MSFGPQPASWHAEPVRPSYSPRDEPGRMSNNSLQREPRPPGANRTTVSRPLSRLRSPPAVLGDDHQFAAAAAMGRLMAGQEDVAAAEADLGHAHRPTLFLSLRRCRRCRGVDGGNELGERCFVLLLNPCGGNRRAERSVKFDPEIESTLFGRLHLELQPARNRNPVQLRPGPLKRLTIEPNEP